MVYTKKKILNILFANISSALTYTDPLTTINTSFLQLLAQLIKFITNEYEQIPNLSINSD